MNASETAARAAGTPITGAEIVCRALAEEGVTKVFGYPGGAVIPIYDEIFKQSAFQHILTGHEQERRTPLMPMRALPESLASLS